MLWHPPLRLLPQGGQLRSSFLVFGTWVTPSYLSAFFFVLATRRCLRAPTLSRARSQPILGVTSGNVGSREPVENSVAAVVFSLAIQESRQDELMVPSF
ncbi:hypothetical protein HPB48_009584 [Haemaphysalis longicornis]|uniref:Uncharacterized protein n=1 Tax=Haemaphysalis longicornis TaxID=44386 RepID=A0A9J6FB97_HAELO|nr:hypothetical protein HPB48_009584 [Haemaphysalis longicornis]